MNESKGVAVVTGGSKGIGKAVSRELARNGWHVQVTGRDEIAIGACVDEISQACPEGDVTGRYLDVADSNSVDMVFAKLAAEYGSMSLLVNCAGIIARGPAAQITEAEWFNVLNTDLSGAFRCSRAAFPLLSAARGQQW